MNSGFRRYGNMGQPPAAPHVTPDEPPQAKPAAKSGGVPEKQFSENSHGYTLTFSGQSDVAIFDYGYFGGDQPEYKGSGGGASSGGGSKLISDSRINPTPSPFPNMFGGK